MENEDRGWEREREREGKKKLGDTAEQRLWLIRDELFHLQREKSKGLIPQHVTSYFFTPRVRVFFKVLTFSEWHRRKFSFSLSLWMGWVFFLWYARCITSQLWLLTALQSEGLERSNILSLFFSDTRDHFFYVKNSVLDVFTFIK